ncbi:MAG: FAD-dependent oxidoreductase [Rhodoferax sp.]|nr:FAD-dependent oxidoreductase [Rhodoferax sp.]
MHPLIIIGAGLAGWTTVREFRKLDTTTPVVLITADNGDFYAKPTLSNAFGQKRGPQQLVTTPAAQMAQTQNVTLLARSRVQSLDTAAQDLTVQTPEGVQTLAYGQLVLATGAQAIRVPITGNAADRVLSVNSLQDFSVFHSALGADEAGAHSSQNHSKTVLVMGAGLIGCEFANDLAQAGFNVHVADPASRPLALLLPQQAGLQIQTALQALGVHWHFGTSVASVDTSDSGLLATLTNGQTVQADVVLSAIGLRADITLASAAGIACERGIVVDDHLQTSATQVYALGDCAQYASAGRRTLPFVMPIMNAAKALAATLAGTPTALAFPLMPVSIKTPAWPVVVATAHPEQAGQWIADPAPESGEPGGAWRFMDPEGAQRGFVLTAKQTARRMEFAKATLA